MSRPLVLVDMDGVVADLEGAFLAIWRQRHPDRPWIDLEARRGFYLAEQYGDEHKEAIWEIFSEAGFYGGLPEIPGAIAAVEEMDAAGLDVRFCTSPYHHPVPCVAEKYTWVGDRLGFDWLARVIIVKDKTLVTGDVLIDDRPDITGARTPAWTHVVFDAAYNRHVYRPRLNAWAQWEATLGPLLGL